MELGTAIQISLATKYGFQKSIHRVNTCHIREASARSPQAVSMEQTLALVHPLLCYGINALE